MENMLKGQIQNDNETENRSEVIGATSPRVNDWFIIKATLKCPDDDMQPEKILGWASWLYEKGSNWTTSQISTGDGHCPTENRRLMEFGRGLGTFTRTHQNRIYTDWYQQSQKRSLGGNSTTRGFLSLRSCFVLPECQRHGIGSALVRYGCERADRLILDTLVTSTPMAKPLYETAGNFKILEHLEVDLKDWLLYNDRVLHGASKYRFWFMVRTFRAVN